MRRCSIVVCLAAPLGAAVWPAPAAARHRCGASDSTTVRATSLVRVYWRRDVLYGCLRGSGLRRKLHDVRERPEGSRLGTEVDGLALDRCGRVTYRAVLASIYGKVDEDPQLHAWIGDERRLLDSGPIDPDSIGLAPAAVLYRRDAADRAAPLEPAC